MEFRFTSRWCAVVATVGLVRWSFLFFGSTFFYLNILTGFFLTKVWIVDRICC